MAPHIIGLTGNHAGQHTPIGPHPITFGRNPDNTIILTDTRTSRRHAEIRQIGPDSILTDLGSANGTLVNGYPITGPHRLQPGDTIAFGEEHFRFEQPTVAPDTTLVVTPTNHQPPTTPVHRSPTSPPPRNNRRPLLIIAGLASLVLLAACIGGTIALTRRGLPLLLTSPTTTSDAPRPTNDSIAPSATRTPIVGAADWTILVYLDGDNNLETDAIGDLNEMEQVGSNDHLNIIVQIDRIHQRGADDDTSNGDWDTTKRYLVTRDDDPQDIHSQELDDLGERNMGDPQTLTDFIAWGISTYPAQHYALILWDHGSSWAGIAFDDSSDEQGIRLPQLDAALRTAQQQTGVERIDLIGFDACLMAQLDVLQTIAPYGHVAVASAELEPNEGWAWDIWLQTLADNPTTDAATLSTAIVTSYGDFYEHSDDGTPTLASFDLTRIDTLRDTLNTLSDAMIRDLNRSYQPIAEARSYAEAYSQPQPEQFSAIDLGDFARLIDESNASDPIIASSKELRTAIEQTRIAEWHANFHERSTGLSIFFPQTPELYPDFYDDASPLPQATSWGTFLTAFHRAGTTEVSAPQINNLQLTNTNVTPDNPITLQGTVSGKDIAHIFFFVGIPNPDRSGVELTDIDFIYPPGSAPNNDIPAWDDGENELNQTWRGTRWLLANGQETIPVLLGPAKYGTDLYGIEGLYTVKDSGEEISAGLLFRVHQGRATLQKIYGFPKGQKQEAQPLELSPVPGDQFTAYLRSYTIQDDKLIPTFTKGQTITFGDTPLSAHQAPADTGAYVAGFLVRDIAGQFNYQYQDITVETTAAAPADTGNQPPPAAAPGAHTDTLAFESTELKFALEYPTTWQTLDTGNSQVYFYDPNEQSDAFISIDVYATKQQPDDANRTLLEQYQQAFSKEHDFTHQPTEPTELAGQPGLTFAYHYTDKNNHTNTGIAFVITSPTSGWSYLITMQALASEFDAQRDTLNAILQSIHIS